MNGSSNQRSTNDDLNYLKSKLMKAEMRGDQEQIDDLKKKIEDAEMNQANDRLNGAAPGPSNQYRHPTSERSSNQYNNQTQHRQSHEHTQELNNLNAKLFKADMMGNKELADEYRKKIEELKNAINLSVPKRQPLNTDLINELNNLKAKLLKAEMRDDQELIREYKAKIDELSAKNESPVESESVKIKQEKGEEVPEPNVNQEMNHLNARLIRAERMGNKELADEYRSMISEAKAETEGTKDSEVVFVKRQENLAYLYNELAQAQLSHDNKKLEDFREKLSDFEYKFNFKHKDDLLRLIKLTDDCLTESVRLKEEEETKGNLTQVKELDKRAKLIRKKLTDYRTRLEELNRNKPVKPKREQKFDITSRVHPLYEKPSYKELEEEREREKERRNKVVKVVRKPNENSMTLRQMFVSERGESSRNETMRFVNASARVGDDVDDEYESAFMDSKSKRQRVEYIEEEDEECGQCVKNVRNNLIIAFDDKVVMIIPEKEPLFDYQLIIRSVGHSPSLVEASEDVVGVVNEYKQKLCALFDTIDMKLIFIEHYEQRISKYNRHFQINCYPVMSSYFEESKMYFMKGINEAEGEWSVNKKLIFLNNEKPINRSLPKGLSYFCVTFGAENEGFAHVIENHNNFPRHFGEEIIGGFLDFKPQQWLKPKLQTFVEQSTRSEKLKKLWSRYEITTK